MFIVQRDLKTNTLYHTKGINNMEKPLNFKPIPYPQTRESAAGWFKRNGVCKAHWAKYFNLERTTVEHLLRGKLKGNFGKSHEAAVLLGMKEKSDD
jgi:hypothetical protein|nr:putative phage associated protein [Neisseria meningitidis alpha522]